MSRVRAARTRLGGALALSALLAFGAEACDDRPSVTVIGHRGAPNEELENSIASFTRARDLGADGVEFDVEITLDGQLIVMHDSTLERTTVCTGLVRERTFAALAACPLQNGEPIRLLEDVLKTIAPWFKLLFVEIKVDEPLKEIERADEGVRVVQALGMTDKIVFTSYDQNVLRRLAERRRREGIHAAWDDVTSASIPRAARIGLDWALLQYSGLEGHEGSIAKGMGKHLCVYQIDSPDQYVKATNAGVEVMMTDSIRTLLTLSGRRPTFDGGAGPGRGR